MAIEAPNFNRNVDPVIVIGDYGGTWHRQDFGGPTIDAEAAIRVRNPGDFRRSIAWIGQTTRELMQREHPGQKKPDGFAFGVASDVVDGVVVGAGKLTEHGWVGQNVVAAVAGELEIDVEQVIGMNDVIAAGTSEQFYKNTNGLWEPAFNAKKMQVEPQPELVVADSTGLATAIITPTEVVGDEAGHVYLRPGAFCGCGREGCIEAHASGSGFEAKFGVRGESVEDPLDTRWVEFRRDLFSGFKILLDRYYGMGYDIEKLHFYGSVALKGPAILSTLQENLRKHYESEDSPIVDAAHYGDNSTMQGAYFAIQDRLAA